VNNETQDNKFAANKSPEPLKLEGLEDNADRRDVKYKERYIGWVNEIAASRDTWIKRNQYFYSQDYSYLRFLISPDLRILDLGCGTGELLTKLAPRCGVGLDISEEMVRIARGKFPDEKYTFISGDLEEPDTIARLLKLGPFDVIVMSETLSYLSDCVKTLNSLHDLFHRETRLVISQYSHLWEPILNLGTNLGLRSPAPPGLNWLGGTDIENMMYLSDFDLVKKEWRQLLPRFLFGIGWFANKILAPLPVLRLLCLRNYYVARSLRHSGLKKPSATVVIPCRNEKGNVEPAVRRLPKFCDDQEILFVEGNSSDGSWQEILRVQKAYPELNIQAIQQPKIGKGDAVHTAFANAKGEVLIILDGDLTVPPEDLPIFYMMIASGKGEFINGSRFVYRMEDEAMRFLNYWGNRAFSMIFSYLLNQTFTDTLCGTKVMTKEAYLEKRRNRDYFGDFDPFGDFDFIFGAAKQNHKIVEIPIRYAARTYGETQISRFAHGWLLLKMVIFAYRKLKAI